MNRYLWPILVLCFVFVGCSDSADSDQNNASNNSSAIENNVEENNQHTTNNTGVNNSAENNHTENNHTENNSEENNHAENNTNNNVEECPDAPVCKDDERLVACRCTSNMDRRCMNDGDCRPDETCVDIENETFGVCYFETNYMKTCPGSEGCTDEGDGILYAGAASRVITQDIEFVETPDGTIPNVYLAGFTIGRPAKYCPEELVGCDGPECCISRAVHDDLKSQIAVFRYNQITVAFVALDVIGYFHTDIEDIRKKLAEEAVDVDLLVVGATHNHQAPDTAGQWGENPAVTGRNPVFFQRIIDRTVDGISEALENMQPANIHSAVLKPGVDGLAISDTRPPHIVDNNLPVIHVTSQQTGETIATLLSWSNHVEVLWSQNNYITSDYPHFVRKYIEEGLDAVYASEGVEIKPELPGLGGVTVMFVGAVGGLVNPGRGGAKDYAGNSFEGDLTNSFAAADGVGQTLASHVLRAAHNDELAEIEEPSLSFATKQFLLPIYNRVFQIAAFNVGLIKRDVYNAVPIGINFTPGPPELLTEVAAIRLGSITFFTAPGEVFPETLVGGFPGRYSVWDPVIGDVEGRRAPIACGPDNMPTESGDGEYPCIVRPDQENPPNWDNAPEGPYVYEKIPGDIPFFLGATMDFLGYMVPEYDFQIIDYIAQPPGNHYEETNGVGGHINNEWMENLDIVLDAVR